MFRQSEIEIVACSQRTLGNNGSFKSSILSLPHSKLEQETLFLLTILTTLDLMLMMRHFDDATLAVNKQKTKFLKLRKQTSHVFVNEDHEHHCEGTEKRPRYKSSVNQV